MSIKEKKYRILSALWKAAVGLRDEAAMARWKATEAAPSFQTFEATKEHLAQLNNLLVNSPLKYLVAP